MTDGSGSAESRLTLGPQVGTNTVSASAAGVSGSPAVFTAVAKVPGLFESVRVENNSFNPEDVTIVVGGQVLFVWPSGSRNHNVLPIAPATIPSSPTLRNGPFEFTQTFNAAGTFRYFCSEHGTSGGGGMSGRVVVQ
jgi:plastocyanin